MGTNTAFGSAIALSADGNTALIGADDSNNGPGAAWTFTRVDGTWMQGSELQAGNPSVADFGASVALSPNATAAMIGSPSESSPSLPGAAWAFAAPAVDSPGGMQFGDQTTDQPGAVQWLPVENTGQAS